VAVGDETKDVRTEEQEPAGTGHFSRAIETIRAAAAKLSDVRASLPAHAAEAVAAIQDAVKAVAIQDAVKAVAIQDAVKAVAIQDAVKAVAIQDAVKAVAAIQDAVKAVAIQDAVKAVAIQDAVKAVALQGREGGDEPLRQLVREEVAKAIALVREAAATGTGNEQSGAANKPGGTRGPNQ
jgi:hypothetical protein